MRSQGARIAQPVPSMASTIAAYEANSSSEVGTNRTAVTADPTTDTARRTSTVATREWRFCTLGGLVMRRPLIVMAQADSKPRAAAMATASVRLWAPSLAMMLLTCTLAVFSLMKSSLPTCRLVRP